MALPINIDDLLHQRKVERTRIEYKGDWNPESVVHTISAFANDFDNMGGGYVLVGVEESNGRPVLPVKGLDPDSIDEIQLDIINKCNLIKPRYIPVIEPYTIDGKEILVLWAPGGEERPYNCPERLYTEKGGKKSNRSYYIRKGSRTLKANELDERELVSMARNVPYDDRINYNANIDDMRPTLLADYLRTVGSDLYVTALERPIEAVSTDMHLVGGPSEYRKPLNVGLMFFTEHPEEYFPYSVIEVVDKPDPTGINMTEKSFSGPLDKQLREALAYIKNYIIKEHITKVPNDELAIRNFNWPYAAVEEALSNAVYHKSYQIHEPITVTITPEKMEILSIPGPDRSISDENLRNRILVSKRYRNRRIGDFLKELNIVEGRNTGVPLIIKAMCNNGSGLPVFETDGDRNYFQVTLPIHPIFLKRIDDTASTVAIDAEGTSNESNEISNKSEQNNSRQGGKHRRTKAEIKKFVIEVLRNKGDLSTNEIAHVLGYKRRTDTLRDAISELLESGEVVYLYPDKPNSRNQKICVVK